MAQACCANWLDAWLPDAQGDRRSVSEEPDALTIRDRRTEDERPLREVYFETRRESFAWLKADQITVEDFEADTRGEKIWVAESSRQVIGFVSVWEPEHFIHHLFVLPSFCRRRIGTRLLDVCLANIGRPARLKCVSANTRALAFYRARGWQAVSVGTSVEGEFQLMEFASK